MGKYVGIDLGTTFSAVSFVNDQGQAQMIPNKKGDYTTPSVVFFGDKTLVGQAAKNKSVSAKDNYAAFAKRKMGKREPAVTTKKGEQYSPEEVSAQILTTLKKDAEAFLGDTIDGCVITVPAYFADPERTATKQAAEMAGLNVLRLINEPTAAALAFGITKDITKKQRVLVYDFGGGTFDVTILDIDNDSINVISTNGDHQLGGYDIDKTIVDSVIEMAQEDGVDIESDKRALQDLWLKAEEAKKALSFDDSYEIVIYVRGDEFSVELDRETFEGMIEGIVGRTLSIMQNAMENPNEGGVLRYEDIDKILLVGGSTRIPFVQKEIERRTKIKPSSEINPDEAVAMGAAFHALEIAKQMANEPHKNDASMSSNNGNQLPQPISENLPDAPKNYEFKDVTSQGIGIVITDSETQKEFNSILIPRNTTLPYEAEAHGYFIPATWNGVTLPITQGNSNDVDYVKVIGNGSIQIRPRDYPLNVYFIVSCDKNALIRVRVFTDDEENEELGEAKVDRSEHNLTEEQVEQAKSRINKLNIGD